LMRRLADQRFLAPADLRRASASAQSLLADWHEAGWLALAPA
jgi:50S ribosomal protein L16 3-hydroxylase